MEAQDCGTKRSGLEQMVSIEMGEPVTGRSFHGTGVLASDDMHVAGFNLQVGFVGLELELEPVNNEAVALSKEMKKFCRLAEETAEMFVAAKLKGVLQAGLLERKHKSPDVQGMKATELQVVAKRKETELGWMQ